MKNVYARASFFISIILTVWNFVMLAGVRVTGTFDALGNAHVDYPVLLVLVVINVIDIWFIIGLGWCAWSVSKISRRTTCIVATLTLLIALIPSVTIYFLGFNPYNWF